MRLKRIKTINYPPIREFEICDIGNVVIIAGANGCGKTRLKAALIETFRSSGSPSVEVDIESTRKDEEEHLWGAKIVLLKQNEPNSNFQSYMKTRTRGGTYTGTVVQVDSDRSVQPVKFQPITWATPDPYEEDTPSTYFLDGFSARWPQLVNKIFQRVASRRNHIANFAEDNPKSICEKALERHPDPFIPFQEIFEKLLPGKKLISIDPKQPKEFHYTIEDGKPHPFSTLSSGEQEVIKIAFDLIWKEIKHCVILVDEPELHLHPTLTFRLIETIKSIGNNTNQFFFFTHSADLISTYYPTGNVYFIDTKSKSGNQAHRLSHLDHSHQQTTRALGGNLGIFAVGVVLPCPHDRRHGKIPNYPE